tara:strand:+ start:536 stop:823 length:288 start_codon:yes stop_codon:yes gene_type:complete
MIKKYFILAAVLAFAGCKTAQQDNLEALIPINQPFPDRTEYVVKLKNEFVDQDLIIVPSLSEALEYRESYKKSHGDMRIVRVQYFGQKNIVSALD